MTPYYISDYEGLTRQFTPDGNIRWEHQNPTAFLQTVLLGPN